MRENELRKAKEEKDLEARFRMTPGQVKECDDVSPATVAYVVSARDFPIDTAVDTVELSPNTFFGLQALAQKLNLGMGLEEMTRTNRTRFRKVLEKMLPEFSLLVRLLKREQPIHVYKKELFK